MGVGSIGEVQREWFDHMQVVVAYYSLMVLPCRVVFGVDGEGVVDREVEWVVGWFGGNVGIGGYCGDQAGELLVELLLSLMGGLQFLGMVA
jgi:hypothetical protein